MMEELKPASVDATGSFAAAAVVVRGARLERLGDYRVLREVGRGGMGVVYEAEQESLGRRVALKVLPLHASRDGKALARFRREAKAAARLHHTNIVPVFEVGQDSDTCFYAMQFIAGQSLDQVVEELQRLRAEGTSPPAKERNGKEGDVPLRQIAHSLLTAQFQLKDLAAGPVNVAEGTEGYVPLPDPSDSSTNPAKAPATSSAVLPGQTHLSSAEADRPHYFLSVARIGQQVAQALAYAHERGIVHRDVKPSNLLLDGSGVVWVTDFGLAKTEDDGLTNPGDLVGTFRYMAPERFRGECDARADVYSLGLTLYELLTLRPAFGARDRARLIEQVKSEEPPRPRSLDPRIPRDLETIVLKAIDKDPARRYSSASALAEDLRRFLADEPVKARRVGLPERLWRWCRRNRAVAGLAGAVVVLLVVLAAGASATAWRLGREQQKTQAALAESRRQAARIALDRGLALCEQGEPGLGMLWLARGLELAPDDAQDLQWVLRANLAGWRRSVHALRLLLRHEDRVLAVAVSPDGNTLLTGSADRTARLWDRATGKGLLTLEHDDAVRAVAFSPDGKKILTGSGDLEKNRGGAQ